MHHPTLVAAVPFGDSNKHRLNAGDCDGDDYDGGGDWDV